MNTSLTNTTSHSIFQPGEKAVDTTLWMWKVGGPIVFVLAVVGNILTLVVVHNMRANTSYLFIMSLAVSDLVINWLNLLPRIFEHIYKSPIDDWNVLACKVTKWIGYSCSMLSSFLVTAISVIRAVTILRRQHSQDKRKHMHMLNVGMWVGTYTLNLYMPFVREYRNKKCSYTDFYNSHLQNYMTWINPMLFSVLPITFVVISSVLIARQVSKSSKQMLAHTADKGRLLSKHKSHRRVTFLVLAICLVFIVLTLPNSAARAVRQFVPHMKKRQAFIIVEDVALFLFYVNSATNFYTYILAGADIRRRARKLLCLAMYGNVDMTSSRQQSRSAPPTKLSTATGNDARRSCQLDDDLLNKTDNTLSKSQDKTNPAVKAIIHTP